MATHIVKRAGHTEKFDEKKVYATCFAACMNAHVGKEEAEKICRKVAAGIKRWITGKKVVTSEMIFREATLLMKKEHKNAAFMYETHRDIA